jgi:hypothetical protein
MTYRAAEGERSCDRADCVILVMMDVAKRKERNDACVEYQWSPWWKKKLHKNLKPPVS